MDRLTKKEMLIVKFIVAQNSLATLEKELKNYRVSGIELDSVIVVFRYFSIDRKSTIQRAFSSTNALEKFDWIFYINNYDDLSHLKNEKDAWKHWLKNGKQECRDAVFDWCAYIGNLNLSSIGIKTKEDACELSIFHSAGSTTAQQETWKFIQRCNLGASSHDKSVRFYRTGIGWE